MSAQIWTVSRSERLRRSTVTPLALLASGMIAATSAVGLVLSVGDVDREDDVPLDRDLLHSDGHGWARSPVQASSWHTHHDHPSDGGMGVGMVLGITLDILQVLLFVCCAFGADLTGSAARH